MDYSVLADAYETLEKTPSKLKKADILADLFSKTPKDQLEKVVLLVRGTVFPGYSEMEVGIADRMVIRSITKATGFEEAAVVEKFKKAGDLGLVAEECLKSRKQSTLMKRKLTVDLVFGGIQKIAGVSGPGSQERKLDIIAEMIVSAKPKEARYVVRTILSNLRIGASDGIIRDAIVKAFLREADRKEATKAVDYAINMVSDLGEAARIAKERGLSGLKKVQIEVGKPISVMLAEKEASIEGVLKKHKRMAIEWKFDGMRAQVHRKGDKIWVYTRRLEDVTRQFPDLVKMMRDSIKSNEYVVEGEVLGVDPKSGDPLPFQALSQRVHRKHDIEKIAGEIPIQMNLFDAIYVDGELLIGRPFAERRKVLRRITRTIPRKLELARQITTADLEEAERFYRSALDARQEGIMLKVVDSPYVFGRHVSGWVKIKPVMETLDLVVIGATWGEGARANWLTSFVLACRDPKKDGLLECGMMSTGLTEDEYRDMTETLRPLITDEKGKEVRVRPKVVVEVEYQEIQKSTNYSSGFALRFPSFKNLRFDKGPDEADTISRVRKLYMSQGRAG